MDAARVTAIAAGITVKGRTAAEGTIAAGEWRDLEDGDVIQHREELLVESDEAKYSFGACRLQRRVAGAWTDAVVVTLDVSEGTSHFRRDHVSVGGNETHSTIHLVTLEKGDSALRIALAALRRNSKSRFSLEGSTTRFYGMAGEFTHANRGESGGFEQDFGGQIVAHKQQFAGGTVVPERGKKLTWANGRTYRIVSVRDDDISYTIDVDSVNR